MSEVLLKIKVHLDELKSVYKVKKIGLFGSFANSTQKADSDIDILIEFDKGGKTFDNYMELKFYLERLFNNKVDLVIKDTLKPRIKNKILLEMKYA